MSKLVERTLDLLELFAEQMRPLSLSEITRSLDIPVSSCHDLLQVMLARGFLYDVGPRAGFYPTQHLFNVASVISQNEPMMLRADARLRQLRDEVEESVSIAKASGFRVTYLLVLEPKHPLRFLVKVGAEVRSLHATSAGKAFLGTLSDHDFDRILGDRLEPMTDFTITSIDKLREEIRMSNARGWFLNREESVAGATTLSSRFTWNRAVYIVTIAGPTGRMEPKIEPTIQALLTTCRDLEERAGPA